MGKSVRSLLAVSCGVALAVAFACGDPQDETDQQTSGAVVDTPIAASETATAIPGLTDTGYTAPDGRPLYVECIAPGLPLPPDLPTPIGTSEPIATQTPGDPNAGKTPPAPGDLPTFDVLTLQVVDTTSWRLHESKCYGYSILLPPDWTRSPSAAGGPTPAPGSYEIKQVGYQQGESEVLWAPNRMAKLDINVFYARAAQYQINNRPLRLGPMEYVLSGPTVSAVGGRQTLELQLFVRGDFDGVLIQRSYELGGGYYLGVNAYLIHPYDEQSSREVRTILDSIQFSQ